MTKHGGPSDHSRMQIGPSSQPLTVFETWMQEVKLLGLKEPAAMTLATVDAEGAPHARIVLCRGWSTEGFVFYTNYASQKGQDLAANPRASLVFYWDVLQRQIRIDGEVVKTSAQESDEYWRKRARESQLSQYVSRQSEPVASREELERAQKAAEEKFAGRDVPRPEHWGGYRLKPKAIEFWMGRPGRLHDRHQYVKTNEHWTYRRLSP